MPQVPVPLGEWRPDLALLDNEFAADVENVFAGINSYMPVPDLLPMPGITPLTDPVVGMTSARTTDGIWKIYVGTRTKLYEWSRGEYIDVSRTAGGAYNVPVGELWSFAQFGTSLIAVATGNTPQAINVDSGTNFAALGGSPPEAHNVKVIGEFVVLSRLGSGVSNGGRKIRWSGINDPTQWTIGVNLCDEQEFPDGGPVQGVAGSEIGYVVQDRAIRTMQFMPGDTTFIFSFTRVVTDHGSISEHGYTSVANVLYFLAEEGFYQLQGNQLQPIGYEKVNEWFLAHSDLGRRNIVQAIAANRPWVAWAYHKTEAAPIYDGVILYNWAINRWCRISIFAQAWATLATTGLDLDTDDPADPDDPDLDSTSPTLDSFAYVGGRPVICAIDINGRLCTLAGPNLQATMETVERHLVPSRRAFVSDIYPMADAAQCLIYSGTRERLQDPVEWSSAVPLEITGSAAVYTSARLHRYRLVIPRADTWTHAQGVMADAQQDGTVA